ncbi:hypothetical protein OO015_12470 [Thermomicrobium sp. 4228-Ro]|uniref:hypothetical protein n=1 Tax=Thermomicrobium sp. 4228-Ro TaxID=2993937 RepID=UPI002249A22E|nr:hypothetical protein [Thermomicrobium sp. 4228-Ro]MCX2728305.1 hypothetical protein [Thermomicrobium sp. 4228-Ro]
MSETLTVLLALTAIVLVPHWLQRCLGLAEQHEAAGDPLMALAWTLAALLSAYAVGLALLALLIAVTRPTLAAS